MTAALIIEKQLALIRTYDRVLAERRDILRGFGVETLPISFPPISAADHIGALDKAIDARGKALDKLDKITVRVFRSRNAEIA